MNKMIWLYVFAAYQAVFAAQAAAPTPEFLTVSANTNGILRGPANFFTTNYVLQARTATTISNLLLQPKPANGTLAWVDNYDESQSGGGGQFVYLSTSTTATNRGKYYQPSSGGTGRWYRVPKTHGVEDVRDWGAKGTIQYFANTEGPDDTDAIEAAMDYAAEVPNTTVEMGDGDFMISRTICPPPFTTWRGISPIARGDHIGYWAPGTNSWLWTHNATRTRLYPKSGMTAPMIYVGPTNRVAPPYPRATPVDWADGTAYAIPYWGVNIENIQLDGSNNQNAFTNATVQRQHGIVLDRTGNVTLDGVSVLQFGGSPLWAEGQYELHVRNCYFFCQTKGMPNFLKRVQDSEIEDTSWVNGVLRLEGCGANIYRGNSIYNNQRAVADYNRWTGVTTDGSTVFTKSSHRIVTGMPMMFETNAPSGFSTNVTYYAYRIDENTFLLNSKIGTPGSGSGARDGFGTSASAGTWTLSAIPNSLIYSRHSLKGFWSDNRLDQATAHYVIISGQYSYANSFNGDRINDVGFAYTNNVAFRNRDDPWYAGFICRDGAWGNTMSPAVGNGTQANGFFPLTVPMDPGDSIGWVIESGCQYNVLGGGFRNWATNYLISATGTTGTEIQFEQSGDSSNIALRQAQQTGIFLEYNTSSMAKITGDLTSAPIKTNDFTAVAWATVPPAGVSSGIISLSASASNGGSAYAFELVWRGDDLVEVHKRSTGASSTAGDASALYYHAPSGITGKEVLFAFSRSGTNVVLVIDGSEQMAFTALNIDGFDDSVGQDVNYMHLGIAGTSLPLGGRIDDAMLFNFAMTSAEMAALKTQAVPTKWKDGSPFVLKTSAPLIRGYAYKIMTYGSGDVFTNVGASSNAAGVVFVATGATPTTWSNGSELLHLGVVTWPALDIGTGSSIPDRTGNSFTWTASGGYHHAVNSIAGGSSGSSSVSQYVPDVTLETGGVRFERSAVPRLTTDMTSYAIGTNDFTISAKATYRSAALGTGIFSISPTSTLEAGAYSAYLGIRADNLIEWTFRGTNGSATSGDYAAQFYPSQTANFGKEVRFTITRRGTNVLFYIDGTAIAPTTVVNQDGFGGTIANGTNYIHWGQYSSAACLDGNLRDGFIANFAMSASEVASLKTNAIPARYLFGATALQTSGTLEAGGVYRIDTYQSGDDFSNLGASNASGNVFTASARTPTTWSNGSVLKKLGVILWPDLQVGIGNEFHDRGPNDYRTVGFTTGIHHIVPKREGEIRWTTSTQGNEQIMGTTAIPVNARISEWTIRSDGGGATNTATVNIGNASAGSQVAVSVPITGTGIKRVATWASRYSTTGNLWVNADGGSTLKHVIRYALQDRVTGDAVDDVEASTIMTYAGVVQARANSSVIAIGPSAANTSSFPALKRSGTTLQARLADDSDYAPVSVGAGAANATSLKITGGASGSPMLHLDRTTGATQGWTFVVPSGALVINDATANLNIASIANQSSENRLIFGSFNGAASPRKSVVRGDMGLSGSANVNGGAVYIQVGANTGDGNSGDIVFQSSLPGIGTTAQGSFTTRRYVRGTGKSLTSGVATKLCTITLGTSAVMGAKLSGMILVQSATPHFQEMNSTVQFGAANIGGTISLGTVTQSDATALTTSGTLTPVAYTIADDGGGVLSIWVNATTSLTPSYFRCRWELDVNSTDVATVTPN